MDIYSFYITPTEYEQASMHGVDPQSLDRRVRLLGWDKNKAINTPIRNQTGRKYWAQIAMQNGIGYQTFMNRVNTRGWDEERAATLPLQDRKAAAAKATEAIRIIPSETLRLAEENGIAYHTLRMRLKRGWDTGRAATEAVWTNKEAGRRGKERTLELYGDWNRFSFK